LISGGINFARGEAEGIDFELAYRRRFDSGLRFDFRGILTYVIERNDFLSPTNPNFATRNLDALGDQQFSANVSTVIGSGPFDLRYSINFIGETYTTPPTTSRAPGPSAATRCSRSEGPVLPDNLLPRDPPGDPRGRAVPIYMGVDNVFDTQPPFGLQGTGGGDPFDAIGRYFYAGATIDF
jgi:hypothetical protein